MSKTVPFAKAVEALNERALREGHIFFAYFSDDDGTPYSVCTQVEPDQDRIVKAVEDVFVEMVSEFGPRVSIC